MGAAADVPELTSDAPPLGAVARARTGEGVGDLVQQRLMDGVVIKALGEVPRHGDALAPKVAQARPTRSAVEVEVPASIEVLGEQGVRPVPHPFQIAHSTMVGVTSDCGIIPTRAARGSRR